MTNQSPPSHLIKIKAAVKKIHYSRLVGLVVLLVHYFDPTKVEVIYKITAVLNLNNLVIF